MSTDAYTKLLLTVIAACLVLLVVQGFRASEDGAPSMERFRVIPVPMGRVMLRVDTETGKTWQTPLPGAVEWKLVQEIHPAPTAPRTGEGESAP